MYHDNLVKEIQNDPDRYFDEKGIKLKPGSRLKGFDFDQDEMPLNYVKPDLIGTDTEGNTIIVEVKPQLLKDDDKNNNENSRLAIGQILDYMCAVIRDLKGATIYELSDEELLNSVKSIKLFIFGGDYSVSVEQMCKLLTVCGINAEFRWIHNY